MEINSSKICWRKEWRRPYESLWSVFENIKIVNAIDGTDLCKNNSNCSHYRRIYTLSKEFQDKMTELTGIDFDEVKKSELSVSIRALGGDFRIPLRYCDECVRFNYHSYFHQHIFNGGVCPFHLLELRKCCPKCSKIIPFNSVALACPFTCSCGMQIYQTDDNPVWRNWLDINPVFANTVSFTKKNLYI